MDKAESEDRELHLVMDRDVPDGKCGTRSVSAKPEVEQARAAHVSEVGRKIDDVVKTARSATQGWKASLEEFAKQLPPPSPEAVPVATPLEGGSQTPQGDNWVKGRKVQYAVALQNEKGPSAIGPWSAALTIGDTAFARVKLPRPPEGQSKSVQLVSRRFFTGETVPKDAKVLIVAIAQPGQDSVDDKKP